MRQIPYTMMKFACFERTVELIYKHVVPKPRDQCSKSEQLTVTFAAGYIAGVFCAVVSHPADTIVSKLNNEKGLTASAALKRVGFMGNFKVDFFRSYFHLTNLSYRLMERLNSTYYHGWYTHSLTMVYLRYS